MDVGRVGVGAMHQATGHSPPSVTVVTLHTFWAMIAMKSFWYVQFQILFPSFTENIDSIIFLVMFSCSIFNTEYHYEVSLVTLIIMTYQLLLNQIF